MNITKVQYTVQDGYVETNKRNIERVMADLRQVGNPGIKYSSYIQEDGKSFVHLAVFSDEEASQILNNLDSFKVFRTELKESVPESPPKAEPLEMVGACFDWFQS